MDRSSATVRAATAGITVTVEPTMQVSVVSGPDRGSTLTLDGTEAPRVLVGTSPACDLVLTDRAVSRRHLAFELAGGRLRVRDLGSTNGTLVNGVAIGEVFLRGGERVDLGGTTLEIARGDDDGEALVSDEVAFGRYLGRSAAMRRLYPTLQRLAERDVPVIVEGETGVGKELLAEALHEASARASGPFVVFDCAGVTAADVEAVLFGREERGQVRPGLFEEASGGTLLVDEIAELDLAVQPKLLRAVDKREIRRVGGALAVPVDVRVISTTRRDLDREVAEGRFREDLFFRIAVTRIELPPLRKRLEDVELLAAHFWRAAGGASDVPAAALARFRAYDWPGNVRELMNAVTRACAVGEAPAPSGGERADASVSPPRDFIDQVVAERLPLGRARERVVEEFERRYVEDAFVQNGRNVTRAAAAAGIARRYFRALRARQRD